MEKYRDVEFDFVITVCDNVARDCSVWLGQGRATHVGFPDLAAAIGSEAEQLCVVAHTYVRGDRYAARDF